MAVVQTQWLDIGVMLEVVGKFPKSRKSAENSGSILGGILCQGNYYCILRSVWDDMLMSNVFSSIWRHVGISELCTEILKIMDEEFCKCIAHSFCWVFVNYAHCFILLFEFLVICCTLVNSFALRFWSMYSKIFLQLHMKMLADKLSIFCSVKICHYRNNRVIENC